MRVADVAASYEAASGHTPRNLDFYLVYAAIRHGIVMSRVQQRSIHFGEAEMPDDPDDLIMHRTVLESMLDGSYWKRRAASLSVSEQLWWRASRDGRASASDVSRTERPADGRRRRRRRQGRGVIT